MNCEFDWRTNINEETRNLAEGKIVQDLQSPHSPIIACHDGPVSVTLSTPDPFDETLTGNIKCKCGARIGIVNGKSDGSKMTYSVIKN